MSLLSAILSEEIKLKNKVRVFNGLDKKERRVRVEELDKLKAQLAALEKLRRNQTSKGAAEYAVLHHDGNVAEFLKLPSIS